MPATDSLRPLNRYDAWKLVALLTMTLDHAGYLLLGNEEVLRLIGRSAMPVFCFLVGFNLHYRFRWELLACALIISLVDWHYGLMDAQNILWGLLLSRMLMARVSTRLLQKECVPIIFGCWLLLPVVMLLLDYGTAVFLWVIAGRMMRELPQSWQAKAYLAGALLPTAAMAWGFVVTPAYGAVMLVMLLVETLMVRQVNVQPWAPPAMLVGGLRFLSRYSLYYYTIHLVGFIVLADALGVLPTKGG